MGASVPTTNEEPVGVLELLPRLDVVVTPLQPPRKKEPTVNARIEGR